MRSGEAASEQLAVGTTVLVGRLFRVRKGHKKRFETKPPKEPEKRPARIGLQLALAYQIQRTIEAGEIRDQAEAARRLGLTRARVSQLLDLTLLAPDIQEVVLSRDEPLGERALRSVARHPQWARQRASFSHGPSRRTREHDSLDGPQVA